MSERKAVVLFGHGARDPEWARPMERTREALRKQAPELRVELAFLELMRPTLEEAIDTLAGQGVTRITVVPMFLAHGGHLKRDVPVLIEAARRRHPGCGIDQALAVGEAEGVVTAMAEYALRSAQAGE